MFEQTFLEEKKKNTDNTCLMINILFYSQEVFQFCRGLFLQVILCEKKKHLEVVNSNPIHHWNLTMFQILGCIECPTRPCSKVQFCISTALLLLSPAYSKKHVYLLSRKKKTEHLKFLLKEF